MPLSPVEQTNLAELKLIARGKVRDVYEFGRDLLFVATDRISAFDYVLSPGIADKGRVLTQLSVFWFRRLGEPNHLLCDSGIELPGGHEHPELEGRAIVVRRAEVVPFECVVRGYLAGSGWKEYRTSGTVCGLRLPPGLVENQRLERPLFTPATKAESGHDENVSFDVMAGAIGHDRADELRRRSIDLYERGAAHAATRGIIVADTKFEWGLVDEELILVDEVLTPDSSRFWPADDYRPGSPQPSFDKQFVRDWLEASGWDKNSPPPRLPEDVVRRTREKYIDAYERLTSQAFAWR